jgi:dihydropteroate synthase
MNNPVFRFRIGKKEFDFTARTHIMGILNVTPDSFSDGGRYFTTSAAVERALEMAEEGADFIDIGGESTRPKGAAYGEGADPISEQEELDRVMPVVEEFVRRSDVPLSVDTSKSGVARRALDAGAAVVNDISGFTFDPAMPGVIAAAGATAVVMHIRGSPRTMQRDTAYRDLFGEISTFLGRSVATAKECGVKQIIVDPGIGFGKNATDNFRLVAGAGRFVALGCPVLMGPSRKSFLGAAAGLPVEQRLEATLAAVTACILHGAHILRVHDVRPALRAAKIADAIRQAAVRTD